MAPTLFRSPLADSTSCSAVELFCENRGLRMGDGVRDFSIVNLLFSIFVVSMPFALAWPMQSPQGPLQFLNFPLIINFLSLGQFQQFENLFHFVECSLQFLDHLVDFFDCGADGGNFWFWPLM